MEITFLLFIQIPPLVTEEAIVVPLFSGFISMPYNGIYRQWDAGSLSGGKKYPRFGTSSGSELAHITLTGVL